MNERNLESNNNQINRFKGTIHDSDNFEWDDYYIFNILESEIPHIKLNGTEILSSVYEENVKLLNKIICDFNNGKITVKDYKEIEFRVLENLGDVLSDKKINTKNIRLSTYYNEYAVDTILKFSKGVFITGDGGIGKSFLLYKFVDRLKKYKKNFICSFGKHDKEFDSIDLDDVISFSKNNSLYFVIDAINEYSKNARNKIKDFIENNIDNDNIRFIVSYRNFSLDNDEVKSFVWFFKCEYELNGIDVDSALSSLIDNYGVDITKYEEIIDFQNPLYIKLLKECLSSPKIVNEFENSESQITFIYEHFIKRIDIKLWDYTKDFVSKYMYDNCIKYIDEKELRKLLVTDYEYYISVMCQHGLLSSYSIKGKKVFYFTIDTLNDFIIGRSFLGDIKGLDEIEIIKLIDKKISKMPSLAIVFILCLFDKFSKNFKPVFNIIKKSKLRPLFNVSMLRMIRFEEKKSILFFQKKIKINSISALNNLAGYLNKPYNFTNYFNKYFLTKDKYLNLLCDKHINIVHLRKKAKIIRALIKKNSYDEKIYRNELFIEYFWFSFWLMGSCNRTLGDLCKKNVYDLCYKCNIFYDEMVLMYDKVKDEYLKNAIIEIICTSSKVIVNKYREFLLNVYRNCNEINSLRLVRIDNVLFDGKREYINCKKKNLFVNVKDGVIKKEIEDILHKVDIYDKYLLPWRYWSKEHIDCNLKFMINNKCKITKINTILTQKYPCLMKSNSRCMYGKENLLSDNKFSFEEINISDNQYLLLFQKILFDILKKYNFNLKRDFIALSYEHFSDSFICKIITISRCILEGTLMCNYYLNNFCINNNTFENKVGYEIYNPYEYDDSFVLNYVHPYSEFYDLADKLDQRVEMLIEQPIEKENGWEDDVNGIKENLFKLIQPILLKRKRWRLLSVSLRYVYKVDSQIKWMDTYLINSTYKSEKKLTGNNDRYITIEQKEYNESILDYGDCNNKECCIMKSVKYGDADFPENSLILPPSNLIKDLNLKYDPCNSTWIDNDNNVILISNNNYKKRYDDVVSDSLYIREEYFDVVKDDINYFSFTSRSKGEGFSDKSEFHMQFNSVVGEIKTFSNSQQEINDIFVCDSCPYGKIQTDEDLEKLRKEYKDIIEQLGLFVDN